MGSRVYGASDDLIEFDGDFRGEYNCLGADEEKNAVLVVLSDGTVLFGWYGKGDRGIWSLSLLRKGSLFDRIDQCDDEDAGIYSDIAHFDAGIKWAYAARNWEEIA